MDRLACGHSMELAQVIGFNGKIPKGVHVHADGQHLLYPLGSTVVIRDLSAQQNGDMGSQRFLTGHMGEVTCVDVSRDGNLVAAGERTLRGQQALVIIWDYASGAQRHQRVCRSLMLQALTYSTRYGCATLKQDQECGSLWVGLSGLSCVC